MDCSQVHLVGPSYRIHQYTDQIYKIVHYPNPKLLLIDSDRDRSKKGNSQKLVAAISRAKKVVLELGLCNDWEYFCTFTLDPRYDRFALASWYKDFSQWIRDRRKATGKSFRYLIVPEQHKNGAWHLHALFSDIDSLVSFNDLRKSGWKVPNKLIKGGYSCWVQYHNKFGFCSLGSVQSSVAVSFYILKYISKSLVDSPIPVGAHLYYSSHGLNRSFLKSELYGEDQSLNVFCQNKYEWCETGFTSLSDECDWSFGLSTQDLQFWEQTYPEECSAVDSFVQTSFFDYGTY